MRKPVKEIENVLQHHGYSINNIICEVMKTFKLKTLCCQVGFQKQDGYSTSEILTLMLIVTPNVAEKCPCFIPKRLSKGYHYETKLHLSPER